MAGATPSPREARSLYERGDAKLAALEQRVYGLERGVQDLNQLFTGRIGEVSAQLAGLSAKLDDRSRTPWATLVSAMGVLLAIVIAGAELAKTPIVDAVSRLERDVGGLEQRLASKDALDEVKAAHQRDREAARRETETRDARFGEALDAVERRSGEAAADLRRRLERVEGRSPTVE